MCLNVFWLCKDALRSYDIELVSTPFVNAFMHKSDQYHSLFQFCHIIAL